MQEIVEFTKSLTEMPIGGLSASIILAAFGLAAFAIYAVLTVAKGKQ